MHDRRSHDPTALLIDDWLRTDAVARLEAKAILETEGIDQAYAHGGLRDYIKDFVMHSPKLRDLHMALHEGADLERVDWGRIADFLRGEDRS